jgi:hypothetical protein
MGMWPDSATKREFQMVVIRCVFECIGGLVMSANIINLDSRREPRKPGYCPYCKSKEFAAIVYGYPNDELLNSDDDSIVLGGCVVSDESAEWQCKQCRRSF